MDRRHIVDTGVRSLSALKSCGKANALTGKGDIQYRNTAWDLGTKRLVIALGDVARRYHLSLVSVVSPSLDDSMP